MYSVVQEIAKYGIVPVIKIDDIKRAVPLMRALLDGGLPVAEVTFRTDCAEEVIRIIAVEFPDVLLGAGTVLNAEQADRAMAAGAKFIVTPGFNRRVVEHCTAKSYPIIPGCSSPTDIEAALECGLETVKFFPAEVLGGIKAIKAMSAPYGNVYFMPTGGIDESNILSYLSCDSVLACGGSFMIRESLTKVTEITKRAMNIIRSVRA